MDVQSGFAEVNGARLYYEIAGAGHPLVLVHAGIADSRMWEPQFEAFAQEYRVLRYDMREYGKSEPVPGKFTHYEDLYALMKFLHMESAYVVGCSKGGTTAVNLTLDYPEMVAALITVCSSPEGFRYVGKSPAQLDEVEVAMEAEDFARAAELEVQIWVDGPKRTPDQVDSRIRNLVRDMDTIALENEAQAIGEEQELTPPAVERLDEIDIPTLVISGELDVQRAVKGSQWLATNIDGARKVIMSGVAHLPNMERPTEFNQIVLGFLKGIE